MKTMITRAAAVFLALGFLFNAAYAEERTMQRTITVSATATVSAIPDLAVITSGVVIEAKTARDALTGNNELMGKVLAGIKDFGIAAKDIQTANFTIQPVQTYPQDGAPPETRGYRVEDEVRIILRDLNKVGETLDLLVTLGANRAGGLSFDVTKADALMDQARTDAMANARRRADLLAKAGGASLGDVLQISEEANAAPPVQFDGRAKFTAASVPIERGTQDLEARVTVTWALK